MNKPGKELKRIARQNLCGHFGIPMGVSLARERFSHLCWNSRFPCYRTRIRCCLRPLFSMWQIF